MNTLCTIADLIACSHFVQHSTGLRCWYRGHSKASYKLSPTAHRSYTEEQERSLNIEFRARAATRHASVPPRDDLAAWLALGQHYGLPTRLLDWTFSPLIAAFFATTGQGAEPLEDATIWAIIPSKLNEQLGFQPYLYPLDAKSLGELIEPAFWGRESPPKIAAAMAIESDPRMQMQQGAFTVHALRTPLCELDPNADWLYHAQVPAQCIQNIRYELKVLSIREDSVFPDLSALARQLSRERPRLKMAANPRPEGDCQAF